MAIKKKAIIIPVVIALLAGGGIFAGASLMNTQNSAVYESGYSVIPAGKNDLSQMISATGKIIGSDTVDVTTSLNAEVSQVNVRVGDYVSKGDILCVFDSTELQAEYDLLKNQIDTLERKADSSHEKNQRDLANTQFRKQDALNRAQRDIDKAVKAKDDAYNAYNKLLDEYNSHIGEEYSEGEIPYDFESVNAQLETMYAQLPSYDDAVTAANDAYTDVEIQYDDMIRSIQDLIDAEEFDDNSDSEKQLEKLAEQLEQCTVYAPQSGIITALNVNEGTIPSSASIMTIVNTDKTIIELTLKETDITRISEGMSAIVTSKVVPDEKMSAEISRIVNVMSSDEQSFFSEDNSGYKVEVTLDEPNEKLLLGMSASVDIVLSDIGERLSVPYSGIVTEDNGSYVYIAVPNNDESGSYTVKKVSIIPGKESDFYTEAAGGEVREGDLVIENPGGDGTLPPVSDGERIFINE